MKKRGTQIHKRKIIIVKSEASHLMFITKCFLIHKYTGLSITAKATANTNIVKKGNKIKIVSKIVIDNKTIKKYFSVEVVCIESLYQDFTCVARFQKIDSLVQ